MAVAGADESVLNPFPLHKGIAVCEFRAAVGAVEKPGQAVRGVLPFRCAAYRFPYLLYGLPRFHVHNGGDCALKNILFFRRGLTAALGLVVLADGFPQYLCD